ncbi:hypothetical protein MXB_2399, partial [Myxobolus squamalis]
DVAVKRTFNDDILFGESIRKDYHICYSGHHLFKWGNFNPLLGEYIGLYNTKDLSQLGYTIIFLNLAKIDFDNNLMFANISNNFEKFAVALNNHDSHERLSYLFRIIGIGY